MTVPSEINRSGPYNGNGVTTVFDYEFKITNENYIRVIKADAAGVETILTLDADYIVSDVGNPAGGQVALTVPLPTGQTLTMIPHVPFTQEIDLENQGAYYADTVETGFDLAVMRDQQLQEQITRAVTIPASEDPAQLDGLVHDILRLADSADNIDTVAGSVANVNTVAGNIAAVNTAATNIAAIIAAPAQAAAAAASATLAQAWAANPEDVAVSGGLYSSLHYAAKAAAVLAAISLPAVPVASSFLQRNAGNTAYVALTPDNARLALTALKGQDIANFAGADENAKIAAMYAAVPTQPYMYRADSHFGLIRDTAPLNYQGTRAALVVQHRDAAAIGVNAIIPGVMFQFTYTGDGNVTPASDLSTSIAMGLTASTIKSGDSSGHCFTAIGELRAVGAVGYNELGLFQGTGTNVSSTHGTISGVEMLLRDSPDAGVTHFDTAMHAVIGRIARYHGGAKDAANFFASSEGTIGPAAILSANPGGLHTWARGIDLKDAVFSTGQAMLFPNNASLAWMNSAASPKPIMFLSAADEVWITGAAAAAGGVTIANSALAIGLHVSSVANAVNNVEIAGAVSGQAPLHWSTGTDANIGAGFGTKGTGVHSFYTGGSNFYKQAEIGHVASSVNYLQLLGAVTTGSPLISAQGTDANIGFGHATKGTGVHSFYTNGTAKQVEIAHVATAVNYLKFSGSSTGNLLRIEPEGTDANAGLLITGKGTGRVVWNVAHISATATAGTNGAPPAQVSGYLQMMLSPNIAIRVPYYNS